VFGLTGLRKPDGGGVAVLNPANNMPVEANQRPAPGQSAPISTTREVSTIPKGGTNATWVYPSPQMFYNALVRKNKAEDCSERDMESVVSVHNG
jgi:cytochrome c heme-lyase